MMICSILYFTARTAYRQYQHQVKVSCNLFFIARSAYRKYQQHAMVRINRPSWRARPTGSTSIT